MLRSLPALAFAALALATAPAVAGAVFATEGLSLRLVAAPPAADGHRRAVLLVDLQPGWKTYWLDPGDAGIPPKLEPGGGDAAGTVAARFPAPRRFDEGGLQSIGYLAPFAVALDIAAPSGGEAPALKVTLGLCRDICVPVAAELKAEPPDAAGPARIDAAFAALPRPSSPERGIAALRLLPDGSALEVAVAPADLATGADLFAAAKGWSFGPPREASRSDGGARFILPVLTKPRHAGTPVPVEAILAAPRENWRAETVLALPPG
ncbi:hypothetical protein GCM10011390_36830 [Aureimonas endophytica]|uniref:Thiol:disulfide interchange protein DsbD N-terminal domain-containing protein n=1 Tax=Aureimonas endophytica TaxID=2027858 RepID=A0A916ZV86_9HYPH|nr:protein-disulfide reductase DsbD domain-containing protein [Aureimonas endophytica]GGE14302.1 hypothetical protein GCM10011390_36830 [Aureimonas endophytica]